jgi:Domain of unknown function (DUF5753)
VQHHRDWSVSKFTRIENGTAPVSKSDLEGLLRYYGETDQQRIAEMVDLARGARERGWWEKYDYGDDKAFESYLGYEDGASSIHMSQGVVVPGLLQIEPYIRKIAETYQVPPERVNRMVELRLERQRRVAARSPHQCYILDESVLHRPVGDVMPEQLRHLLRVADKPTVSIRVISSSQGLHFGLRGSFVLLGFGDLLEDVLYLEGARRGDLLIAERESINGQGAQGVVHPSDEVARYQDGFDHLLKIALSPADSLDRVRKAVDELR